MPFQWIALRGFALDHRAVFRGQTAAGDERGGGGTEEQHHWRCRDRGGSA
jgi:hypothetical protein